MSDSDFKEVRNSLGQKTNPALLIINQFRFFFSLLVCAVKWTISKQIFSVFNDILLTKCNWLIRTVLWRCLAKCWEAQSAQASVWTCEMHVWRFGLALRLWPGERLCVLYSSALTTDQSPLSRIIIYPGQTEQLSDIKYNNNVIKSGSPQSPDTHLVSFPYKTRLTSESSGSGRWASRLFSTDSNSHADMSAVFPGVHSSTARPPLYKPRCSHVPWRTFLERFWKPKLPFAEVDSPQVQDRQVWYDISESDWKKQDFSRCRILKANNVKY